MGRSNFSSREVRGGRRRRVVVGRGIVGGGSGDGGGCDDGIEGCVVGPFPDGFEFSATLEDLETYEAVEEEGDEDYEPRGKGIRGGKGRGMGKEDIPDWSVVEDYAI
jgi:hypothetical protein